MVNTLPEIITSGAKALPDQIAFKCGQKSETFKSMEIKMHQLSNKLVQLGVKKGDRIGIYMNRIVESAIAVYGIMNAGAVFVPIDPSSPVSRIKGILEDCDISILISSQSQKGNLTEIIGNIPSLQTVIGFQSVDIPIETISWESIFEQDAKPSNVNLAEDDLAYIIFTSGTTGKPKGIMHTHKSGMSYARLSAQLYKLTPDDVVGSVSPLHFDQSTFGYFSTPWAKATAILVSDGHLAMLGSFSNMIEDERITILYAVPLVFIQLLDLKLLKGYKHLKWMMYGGEPFPPKKLNELMALLHHVKISNVYGPAEVNQCTYKTITEPVNVNQSIPLGKVWSETEVKVVDELDRTVPRGENGELLVTSSTMMKGYWNNPQLNRISFYKEVQSGEETLYYRTGDIVRWNEQDELVFVGRKDRQAKLRGYRIELREVENCLYMLEHIKESAVFIVETGSGKSLCAAIAWFGSERYDQVEIINHLSSYIPKYSVPDHFIFLEKLPRAKSGKIDYNILEKEFENFELNKNLS